MCGIVGIVDGNRASSSEALNGSVFQMSARLVHRGPDDTGSWVDAAAGVALGHRRLSIIDLSPMGHQPMESPGRRFVITFNGEIYNYKSLRNDLIGEGVQFRSQSDTEVLLAAIERWGFEAALRRVNGMFAFALWDRHERELLFARDRFGEKPIYYGLFGHTFLFASELKAFYGHSSFAPTIDRGSTAQFLRFCCVPAPRSIFSNVAKLPVASWARFRPSTGELAPPRPYWSMLEVVTHGDAARFRGSETEAADAVDGALRASVSSRMIADVPLGAFLSGGIDSSMVVALMQCQSERPIRTFTIGFNESQYNEAIAAKEVARLLGTDHVELYVTPEEARAVIPKLPMLYDEPFADSSQIPTYLVASLARRHVTVALTGDGGDELFGGYNRYPWAERLWRGLSIVPNAARMGMATELERVGSFMSTDRGARIAELLPGPLSHRLFGTKVQKVAELLRTRTREALFLRLLSAWRDPERAMAGGAREPVHPLLSADRSWQIKDFTERMMYVDSVFYMPDDILVKVDRATMGVSLEARCPFLDPNVAELAASLPKRMKVRGLQGKWILRKVLGRYLPSSLIDRPKMGFAIPIDGWLRGPLRDWAEAHLDERGLKHGGYFDPVSVRNVWQEHLSGKGARHLELWAVLMFQAWNAAWRENGPRSSNVTRVQGQERGGCQGICVC